MKIRDRYFNLNDNVILVEGANGGLLQDLDNQKIYSIDSLSRVCLKKLISGQSINEVILELENNLSKKLLDYLEKLVDKKLGFYSDMWIKPSLISKKIINNLDTVWLELRKACNLNCCHCYIDCNFSGDLNLNILNLNQWKKIIIDLKKYNPKRVVLIGGEPLLFKEIDELIRFINCNLNGTDIVLYSNLTLLKDNLLECIKNNNVKVVTSIYSNKSEVHDKITGRKGSFNKTIDAIKKMKSKGIYIRANMVVMNYNYNDIDDTQEFIYKLTGFKSKLDIIRNVGSEKSYLIPEVFDKNYTNKIIGPNFKGVSKEEYLRNYSGNSCWQGKINITCDGYVSPCIMGSDFIDKDFNIKISSLDDILNNYLKPRFWNLSKDYIEVCRDCEYRYICKDCRPIAAGKSNFYKRSSKCKYNPYERKWEDKM